MNMKRQLRGRTCPARQGLQEKVAQSFPLKNSSPDFPKGPEVKTLCSHCRGYWFRPGWGTKTPHASQWLLWKLTVNEGGGEESREAGRGGRWWRPDQMDRLGVPWEVADKVVRRRLVGCLASGPTRSCLWHPWGQGQASGSPLTPYFLGSERLRLWRFLSCGRGSDPMRSMETPARSLDARLRAADGSLSAKSFQVRPSGFMSEVKGGTGIGCRLLPGRTEG